MMIVRTGQRRGPMRWARPLVAASLLLAACGGGGDDPAVSDETTTSTAAGEPGTPTSTDAPDAPDAAAGAPQATTTTRADQAGAGSAAASATPGADAADDTPGLPAAGQYRYHATGSSKFGANPEQPINMDTTTTVVHLGGGKVRQTSEDQETVLEWAGAQVLLHTMDLTRPGFERHFEAKPPVQFAPAPLQVGQAWGWKLTATDVPTTVDQQSRVDRLETITVGGKAVKTIVVVTKVTISGDVSGTIDLTQWVDNTTGIPARIHAKTNIVTFAFTSDTTSDFVRFDPT